MKNRKLGPEEEQIASGLLDLLSQNANWQAALFFLERRGVGAPELALACDVLNGHMPMYDIPLGASIAWSVEDGARLDGLDKKWGVADDELTRFAKLLEEDAQVARAVWDVVVWFWAGDEKLSNWIFENVKQSAG